METTTQEVVEQLSASLADRLCEGDQTLNSQLLGNGLNNVEQSDRVSCLSRLLKELIDRKSAQAVKLFLRDCPAADLERVLCYPHKHLRTAVHLAVIAEQPEIVALLAKAGANLVIPDKFNKSPLHYACDRFLPTKKASGNTLTVMLQLHAGLCFNFESYHHCYHHIGKIKNVCLYGAVFQEADNDQPGTTTKLALFNPDSIVEVLSESSVGTIELIGGVKISRRRQLALRCMEIFNTINCTEEISPLCAAVFSNWQQMQSQVKAKATALSKVFNKRIKDISTLTHSIDSAIERVQKIKKRKKWALSLVLFVVFASALVGVCILGSKRTISCH